MFSPENREKLIKELNIQLENKEFYSVDNDIALPANLFEEFENVPALQYANIASITGIELDKNSNDIQSNLINNYYESNNFRGVGLFRPLVNSEFNPLNKTVYNYQATYATPINGLAFMGNDGGLVENTTSRLYSIVDNTSEFNYNMTNDVISNINAAYKKEQLDNDPSKVAIKPIAYNTYQMSDILENTLDMQVINFTEIPKELSLTKPSKWRSIWFKEIDLLGTIKNIFNKK